MPTLLSVNSYFYRRDGAEVVFLEHNRLFEQAGWQVLPFSMQHPDNHVSEWSEYFVKEMEYGSDYSFLDKVSRVPKVIYSIEAKRNIKRLIEAVRPDVCHCHSIYHHLSPSILGALRKAGIPTVMTLHDLKIACPAYHMFNTNGICEECKGGGLHNVIRNRCVKESVLMSAIAYAESLLHQKLGSYSEGVDRFIAPSRFYVEKLVEWGWPRHKFVHIPNPISVADYPPVYEGKKHILYLGRLSPEKGVVTLVRAAALAKVAIRIAGSGPQLQLLQREAIDTGATVKFLGYLSGQSLRKELGEACATVLASECYRDAPMSVLESFALGKPVIGARIGGIPELVRDGITGWMFESGSVEDLAKCLRVAVDLPDTRLAEMGRVCRDLVEREYSSSLYRERIRELYSQLGVSESAARANERDALVSKRRYPFGISVQCPVWILLLPGSA